MKNIVIVAHKFLVQVGDDLALFLKQKKFNNVFYIYHSFSDSPDRRSFFIWYKNGEIYQKEQTKDYKKWAEPFIYLKEFYFTFKWVLQSKIKWDYYIGMDGFCALIGNTLRFFKKVKKTVYWAIDFVPQRFKNPLMNKIYHLMNIQAYKKSDEMWDLSPRMHRAREKFLGIKKTDYKKHKIVAYGVWIERIKKYDYSQCEQNTLVFMGHLLEKQGIQLIIRAVPEIIKKIPDFKFKIIGEGQYKQALIKLANDLNVAQHCDFKGKIDKHQELENEIAKSCLAIAPYIKELDTWTYYADPGKIKVYLGSGVPVLLTNISWNAQEIEKNKCGIIISENQKDVVAKILFLMKKENNQPYRENAKAYSKKFNYEKIFSKILIK